MGVAWSGHVRRLIEASATVCLPARSSRAGATAPTTSLLLPCHKPHRHRVHDPFTLSPESLRHLQALPPFYTRCSVELHARAAGPPSELALVRPCTRFELTREHTTQPDS
jgi:hypothetical protein